MAKTKTKTEEAEAPSQGLEVVASEMGFLGGTRRRPGDRFFVPEDTKPASWFAPEGGWPEEKPTKRRAASRTAAAVDAAAADGGISKEEAESIKDAAAADTADLA